MKFLTTNGRGILLCLIIAIPAWILGTLFPIIGGPVIAILLGMLLAIPLKEKGSMAPGIQFTSKKILQWAVILLGFGLDLTVVLKTGQQSLPIILCTITVSLLIAFLLFLWRASRVCVTVVSERYAGYRDRSAHLAYVGGQEHWQDPCRL